MANAPKKSSGRARASSARPGTREKQPAVSEPRSPARPRVNKPAKPAPPRMIDDSEWQSPERWDGIFA